MTENDQTQQCIQYLERKISIMSVVIDKMVMSNKPIMHKLLWVNRWKRKIKIIRNQIYMMENNQNA